MCPIRARASLSGVFISLLVKAALIALGLVELLFLFCGKFHWHQFLSVLAHPAPGGLHVFPGEG